MLLSISAFCAEIMFAQIALRVCCDDDQHLCVLNDNTTTTLEEDFIAEYEKFRCDWQDVRVESEDARDYHLQSCPLIDQWNDIMEEPSHLHVLW
jgi:hypothetical protein